MPEVPDIQIIPIECSSLSSVRQFASNIREATSALDCVLLGAGVALPTREVTTITTTVDSSQPKDWPTTFVVNVLAPIVLALELTPLLQRAGGVLEFVSSISYCNVSSEDIAPFFAEGEGDLGNKRGSVLEFFNGAERWTTQRAYYETKLMLMFCLEGLVRDQELGLLKDSNLERGKGKDKEKVTLLACCPGQCRGTNLYRQFGYGVRAFMVLFNAFIARTAEQGARTLVTGLLLQGDEKAVGKMWVNDGFDDWSPGISENEWRELQGRVWEEVKRVLERA